MNIRINTSQIEGFILRIKNLLASTVLLSFFYIFYTNQSHFVSYFAVGHSITFFNWSYQFTTFQIFRVVYVLYIFGLTLNYFLPKKVSPAKAVYFFRAVYKFITNPVRVFEKGLDKKEKLAVLAILVKAFYTPLMLSWLAGHISRLLTNISYIVQNSSQISDNFLGVFQSHLFFTLFGLILFLDVFFFTFGYLVELDFLKNKIKSVEPTLFGWVVTLLCYPPFNNAFTSFVGWHSTDFPKFSNPYLFVGLNILILIAMGIYSWASLTLGFKASNLTHRGIIDKGPYKYIRHPAYVAKNFAWWIGAIPAFIIAVKTGTFMVVTVAASLIMWTGLYFLRALTEERHLRSVNKEYDEYSRKVKYRFIPGVV